MYCPVWLQIFAALAIAYLISSVAYLLITRNYGTPFKDSLTPNQIKIKQASSASRGRVFGISFVVSFILIGCCWFMYPKRSMPPCPYCST